MPQTSRPGECRICGCTEERACGAGCSWAEPDLCSSCAEMREAFKEYFEDTPAASLNALLRNFSRMIRNEYQVSGGGRPLRPGKTAGHASSSERCPARTKSRGGHHGLTGERARVDVGRARNGKGQPPSGGHPGGDRGSEPPRTRKARGFPARHPPPQMGSAQGGRDASQAPRSFAACLNR